MTEDGVTEKVKPTVTSGGSVAVYEDWREYAIIKWPDGTETCAWKDEHVRRRTG